MRYGKMEQFISYFEHFYFFSNRLKIPKKTNHVNTISADIVLTLKKIKKRYIYK